MQQLPPIKEPRLSSKYWQLKFVFLLLAELFAAMFGLMVIYVASQTNCDTPSGSIQVARTGVDGRLDFFRPNAGCNGTVLHVECVLTYSCESDSFHFTAGPAFDVEYSPFGCGALTDLNLISLDDFYEDEMSSQVRGTLNNSQIFDQSTVNSLSMCNVYFTLTQLADSPLKSILDHSLPTAVGKVSCNDCEEDRRLNVLSGVFALLSGTLLISIVVLDAIRDYRSAHSHTLSGR
eukprot:m.1046 g.1046  ORF g.1046 m.1046 type:complete len:234 (+) comp535_c0_seq1:112-813(+)